MAKGITISMFALRLNSGINIVGTIGVKSNLLITSASLKFKIINIPMINDPSNGGINFLIVGNAKIKK